MDDYVDDCRGKVAELEARLAAATEGHAEFRQMAFDQAQKWDASNAYTMQRMGEILDQLNAALLDRDEARAEVETLRERLAELKANLAQAEKAEAALPPAGILSDIRTIAATYAFIGTSGVPFATAVRCGERVQAWLSTLPTQEAQP